MVQMRQGGDTYRAVLCTEISSSAKAGIEAAVLADLPCKKELSAGQVRVQVRSAAINFPELLMLQNKYQYKPKLPFVLCTEGAGAVIETGTSTSRFALGDRVMFSHMGGCACEELVLHENQLVPLPAALSFSQGAGFLMGYTTGYHALVTRGRLREGEWLLVTGAAGGMGAAAVQLGVALGAKVIAAASSDEKLEVCKQLGAHHVVNYTKVGLKEAVSKITKGAFCDVIYEPVGGEVFDQCIRCVSTRGYARLLVVGFASGTIPKVPANMTLIKGFDLVGVRMGAQFAIEPELAVRTTEELVRMANNGGLAPLVSCEFPLERYKEALLLMAERKVVGKCCLTMGTASRL